VVSLASGFMSEREGGTAGAAAGMPPRPYGWMTGSGQVYPWRPPLTSLAASPYYPD
jgi:hypothetical protein